MLLDFVGKRYVIKDFRRFGWTFGEISSLVFVAKFSSFWFVCRFCGLMVEGVRNGASMVFKGFCIFMEMRMLEIAASHLIRIHGFA